MDYEKLFTDFSALTDKYKLTTLIIQKSEHTPSIRVSGFCFDEDIPVLTDKAEIFLLLVKNKHIEKLNKKIQYFERETDSLKRYLLTLNCPNG
jgi:hypothetical protein